MIQEQQTQALRGCMYSDMAKAARAEAGIAASHLAGSGGKHTRACRKLSPCIGGAPMVTAVLYRLATRSRSSSAFAVVIPYILVLYTSRDRLHDARTGTQPRANEARSGDMAGEDQGAAGQGTAGVSALEQAQQGDKCCTYLRCTESLTLSEHPMVWMQSPELVVEGTDMSQGSRSTSRRDSSPGDHHHSIANRTGVQQFRRMGTRTRTCWRGPHVGNRQ